MSQREDIHERVLTAKTQQELMDTYGDWAVRYDHDLVESWGYPAPALTVSWLTRYVARRDLLVLDAGCGTGLVGQILRQQGFETIDGLDYSKGMLAQARAKNVYRHLRQADMNQSLPIADASYDIVTCVGTFTASHVKPDALAELVRITRAGGWLCFTVRSTTWDETRFREHVLALERDGRVRLHEQRTEPYIEQEGASCKLVLLERPS
ncbi:MAG: class I SAM-dependent methyltransferase [Burkholderiaceae bacterium]